MALQMGLTILLGVFVGQFLDKTVGTAVPWFTIAFALLSTFAALYLAIKDLLKP